MSGSSVQKLQVIDPAVLKSLLEQLNANMKRQTVANIVDDTGMEALIHYDKFLKQSSKSSLKDSLRQNLYSRIQQHKDERRKRSLSQPQNIENQHENQDEQQDDQPKEEMASTSMSRLTSKFHARTVQNFQKKLEGKGIKGSKDGFLVVNRKKTNIPYDAVLNDFGRNIKSKGSFKLSENEKRRTMRILSDKGFAQYLIPNQIMKTAYGTNIPDIRQHLIEQTSPMKKRIKKQTKKQGGEPNWEKVKRQIYQSP